MRLADTLSTSIIGRRSWRIPVLAAAVLLLGGAAVAFWRSSSDPTLEEARSQLETNRPIEALKTLDRLEKSGRARGELVSYRAAAFHALHDHDNELAALRAARGSPGTLEVRALRGVTEDLARQGNEGPRKDFLDGLEVARSTGALKAIAESGITTSAWGALRYLDGEHRTETLDLASLYGGWLEGSDCAPRTVAARRMGELGLPEAVAALQKARKRKMPHGCGQEEIAAALRALDR